MKPEPTREGVAATALPSVLFEETGERRAVVSGCQVCGVTEDDIRAYECVVSPFGVAHHATEYGDTACGKDATRDAWWWPL